MGQINLSNNGNSIIQVHSVGHTTAHFAHSNLPLKRSVMFRQRRISEHYEKTTILLSKQPFSLLIAGFLLTTLVGSYINHAFMPVYADALTLSSRAG
jgi:hypothetical protein